MIVCLQEHKIPYEQLSSRSEPRQLATVPGYESFWSCCVDPEHKGLNGTVTYARIGTVLSSDSAPLRDQSLDRQGRCVMTDHGAFVVFNVYVPNSGGHPMSMKMKFLHALRRAMQRERDKGKAVVLVGDLNISHKAIDIFWKDRTVHIQAVLDEVEAASAVEHDAMPSWKRQLAQHWGTIERILETREVVQTRTTNSLTKEIYNKYRLKVNVNGCPVFLGKHETAPEYCTYSYDFHSAYYTDEETGERIMTRENRTMCVGRLTELMYKLANVEWPEEVQREVEASEPRVSPKRKWLSALLEEDGMVDAFRHLFPNAQGRFTVWHQFTNCRYNNEGARIDYTLIDQSLLPNLLKGDDLRCCMFPPMTSSHPAHPSENGKEEAAESQVATSTDAFRVGQNAPNPAKTDEEPNTEARSQGSAAHDQFPDPCSEEMALRAATAGGRFRPVSFEGGGIAEASQDALDSQFGPPATGMVYTPPSYSDHIGVSLLLGDSTIPKDVVLGSDAATRKAQPHKIQRTIASFFGVGAPGSSSAPKKSSLKRTVVKAPAGKKPPQKNFFAPSSNNVKPAPSSTSSTTAPKRSLPTSIASGASSKQRRKENKPAGKSTLLYHFRKQEK